ncbi:MAG: hypothetical protein NT027_16720, partial [Proteobacteria bacterium]|nr:hypothetical protein [Pseudomonadota bacterium]
TMKNLMLNGFKGFLVFGLSAASWVSMAQTESLVPITKKDCEFTRAGCKEPWYNEKTYELFSKLASKVTGPSLTKVVATKLDSELGFYVVSCSVSIPPKHSPEIYNHYVCHSKTQDVAPVDALILPTVELLDVLTGLQTPSTMAEGN